MMKFHAYGGAVACRNVENSALAHKLDFVSMSRLRTCPSFPFWYKKLYQKADETSSKTFPLDKQDFAEAVTEGI